MRKQSLPIDYVLHRVLANGSRAPKVFKGWQIELAAHERRTLTKRHSLRAVTFRPGAALTDGAVSAPRASSGARLFRCRRSRAPGRSRRR